MQPALPFSTSPEANPTSNPSWAPQVLAVGPWHQREFSLVRQQIEPRPGWPTCQTLQQAADLLARQPVGPELLLIAQPRPGYYTQTALEHLQRLAPLARIVLVAGSWCEGELRTGKPVHGVLRLYWYDLAAWWRDALACLQVHQRPPWSEPLEDGYAQRLRAHAAPLPTVQAAVGGLIEVNTQHHETFVTLATVLNSAGWAAIWQRCNLRPATTSGTRAGIWDGGQLDPPEIDRLSSFCHSIGNWADDQVPVIVLLDFPRSEHLAMATAAGARAILPKPYRVDDLLNMLGGLRVEG